MKFRDAVLELGEVGLTLGSADDLADLREEDVHRADGLSVFVLLHVEGLDVLGVVREDDGPLEMLLHEVALVLALQVSAPVDGVLELVAGCDCRLEDFDTLSVGQTDELGADYAFEALQKGVVVAVVKELDVVAAVLESILDEALDEVLGEVHVVLDVVEGHLRLDHPELSEVARGVGVLGAEGGAEGVDFAYGCGSELTFELTAYREAGHLAEEVLLVVGLALLVLGNVAKVERGDLEHLACALGVGLGDQGSVEVDESLVVEILVDGVGHLAAEPVDGSEGVGAGTKVSYRPQILEGGVLLLERVAHGVAFAVDLNFGRLDFDCLTASDGLDEPAFHCDAGACADTCERGFGLGILVDHDLDVPDGRAVVEGDKCDFFVSSFGPHPTFGEDVATCGHCEQVLDFRAKYFL